MFGLRLGAMGRVGSGLTLTQAAANVRNAYSTSPQVWYDPSDLSTLYQDSAGTTPVTAVGQPVGLMLDKSRGLVLGSDLVSNGGFDSDTVWTKGTGWTIGSGVATKTAGTGSALTQVIASTATRWYRVTATITRTAGTLTVSLGTSGQTATFSASSTATFFVLAGSSTQTLSFSGDAAFAGTVDAISVRELPGLHASQPTALSRPVLSSRVNQVLNSGFAGAVAGTPGTAPTSWSFAASSGTTNSVSVSDGAGGFVLAFSATAARHLLIQVTPSLVASSVHDFTVTLVATSGDVLQQLVAVVSAPAGATTAYLQNGAVVAGTVVPAAGDVIGVRITLSTTAGTCGVRVGVGCLSNTTASASFAKASFVAQNENTLPYQRVTTATDYDADFSKFPPHLVCDGTDDGMVTPSWDLTSTDKVTVVAGVRKLSDAAVATGILVELSTSTANVGTFGLQVPRAVAGRPYAIESGGSIAFAALAVSGAYTAPDTRVVTGTADISGDLATIRIDGVQVGQSTANQGTGSFGNYPLYLFRRGGTIGPFNGRLYGLTIIAAQLSANDITVLEKFQAAKTGVALP